MNLSTKILIGLALGIIAGLELGAEGAGFAKTWIGPLGTIFMNMIKMVIVPLVFSSLVMGVASLGDIKKVGRIGIKTVGYYLGTTAFAIVIGLAAVIIGEVLFGKFASKRKLAFAFTLASVILGAVIYYMVYQFVLWLKMPSEDMKLFSAIVVAIFLAIPYLKEKRTLRKGASK